MGLFQPVSCMAQRFSGTIPVTAGSFQYFLNLNRQVASGCYLRTKFSNKVALKLPAPSLTINSVFLFSGKRWITTGASYCRHKSRKLLKTCHYHKRLPEDTLTYTRALVISNFACQHTMSSRSGSSDDATSSSSLTGNRSMGHMSGQDMAHLSTDDAQMMQEARDIFYHAVNAVLPHQMIGNRLQFNSSTSMLKVDDRQYKLHKNVHVVGFGKAVLGMARAVEDCIGEHIISGVISVPVGAQEALRREGKEDMLLQPNSSICVREGAANNLPDQAAFNAASEITDIVKKVGDEDLLIVLISGGGSALLPSPKPPVTLADMLTVTQLMSKAGASIMHLNTVRKHTDLLKGGGLAKLAHPAQVISLILSDVIGDPLDFIASGPTVPDLSTPKECLDLFSHLGVMEHVPSSVIGVLQEEAQDKEQKTSSGALKSSSHQAWTHVRNILVGTNKLACAAACERSDAYGYLAYTLSTELDGEAKSVGKMFAKLAKYITLCFEPNSDKKDMSEMESSLAESGLSQEKLSEIQKYVQNLDAAKHKGVCIIAGGETTVTVNGDGKGGRNQEMAVCAALELEKLFSDTGPSTPKKLKSSTSSFHPSSPGNVMFLSAGTDGQDGPTTAAGGVVSISFASCVRKSGLSADDYLERNDTHTLLSTVNNGSSLVITGLTGTNVMDIHLLLIRFSRQS